MNGVLAGHFLADQPERVVGVFGRRKGGGSLFTFASDCRGTTLLIEAQVASKF